MTYLLQRETDNLQWRGMAKNKNKNNLFNQTDQNYQITGQIEILLPLIEPK